MEKSRRNLFAAIENGIPCDEPLKRRVQELKSDGESLRINSAGVGRNQSDPVDRFLSSNIEAFSKATRVKFQNKEFAERYLQVLVDEIVVSGDTATMKGSYAKLATAITHMKRAPQMKCPVL